MAFIANLGRIRKELDDAKAHLSLKDYGALLEEIGMEVDSRSDELDCTEDRRRYEEADEDEPDDEDFEEAEFGEEEDEEEGAAG